MVIGQFFILLIRKKCEPQITMWEEFYSKTREGEDVLSLDPGSESDVKDCVEASE